ncbi:ABC transporter ATP-binding protein [Ligilactobacillus pobuzihii]|uniref:Iron ABC transporter ATP-binding protein n=1 Tax=Ligilactobacillus pobuzihii TaxID=449659 RepID=A0A0R2LIP3_9LACO|nr:ABC transporter ATP-binding protein [Ligilactobacillus pobuzihii]KRK10354.1 iron ABC transporter ATP-binding protein [Ligilactobacillus pobuzihii E100301 = KCTC 13174]KRN98557.1 iron ABC transporter ATP-binding protein [Ligilactobacillus pobuzihii]GEN47646.1 iron-dicitrate ABC transporter ATP-binding protein [Ligilactobacillus pobuzihii]
MQEHDFYCENINAGYTEKAILNNVSLRIPAGKISVLIGANGCGKSTLLRVLAGFLIPTTGQVKLDGKQLKQYSPKQVAQILAVLPQQSSTPAGLKVIDLISQGRFPHHSLFSRFSKQDERAVLEAMEMVGITELAKRDVSELSGGQKQRVWIALALAQQTDIIFLDEPTTFLDMAYQVEILNLLADLNRRFGKTIVVILHDINLAARYADRLFALKDGVLIKEGAPRTVVKKDLIKEVFGLNSMIVEDPVVHSPVVVPIGK